MGGGCGKEQKHTSITTNASERRSIFVFRMANAVQRF